MDVRGGWERSVAPAVAALREAPALGLVLATGLLGAFQAGLLIPVLPLFLMQKGMSFLHLGGLFALVAATPLAARVVATRLPGLFARREVVLALLLLSAAVPALYLRADGPLDFLAATALLAFLSGAAAPGLRRLLAQAAPASGGRAVGAWVATLGSFAYAAAVVAAFALASLGFERVFALAAAVATASFVATASLVVAKRLKNDAPSRPTLRAGVLARLRGAFSALGAALARRGGRQGGAGTDANARLAAAHVFLFGLSVAVYPVYFPLRLAELGIGLAWIGVAVAASWVVFGIVHPLGARWAGRSSRPRELAVAALVAAAVCNVVIAVAPLPGVVAAWVALGVADGLQRPVGKALVLWGVGPASRLAAFAATEAALTAARVAAPFALALAVMSRGLAFGFLLVALVVLLSAVPLLALRAPAAAPAAAGAAAGA